MKILIVIDSLGGGGAERSTQVLCDFLAENQIYFEIVCLYFYPDGYHQEMMDKGYHITFLKKGTFVGQTREIAGIIAGGQFDLVHSILFKSNLRVRFSKLLVNFKHLESLVNCTYSEERKLDIKVNQKLLRFYRLLDRITARMFVDHFHSITNTVRKHYIHHVGINAENVTVVYRGRKPFPASLVNKTNRFTLINVARQDFQKGQIFLLHAIKEVKDRGIEDLELIILGIEGRETKKLKAFVKENNLEKLVNFAGFTNNVNEYLARADLFIFSSLFEGLGGALIEAQAAGLPIISNNLEVLREVVNKDENGIFVDIKNSKEVADAIIKIKESPELRRKFSDASILNFNKKFKESISNQRMLELYRGLC